MRCRSGFGDGASIPHHRRMSGSSNFPAYLQRFGFFAGLALYCRTKLRGGTERIAVPGMSHPILMRTGTSDRSAFNEVIVKRWYDHPFPGEPRFIVDAGANVGYASVRFAELYPQADIVAIEPDRENFEILQQNVAPYPRVRGLQCGVWPRSAQLVIENPEAKSWAFRVREARGGERGFPAVGLNELVEQHSSRTLDLLKLDIEGAELELFRDDRCHEWLARTNMIFVELHDRIKAGCTEAMENAIARHGFERQVLGSNLILTRKQRVA
jgi:FkbM family methyltransferase